MRKKIGLVAMALVLALGALGVGFASWTDNVTIDGTVDTGYLCAEWYTHTNHDAMPCGPDGSGDWTTGNKDPNLDVTAITGNPDGWPTHVAYYITDKNVACTEISGLYTDTLLVTVYNAYPLYYNDFEVEFENCGTLPVRLQSIVITPLNFTLANDAWMPSNGGEIWVSATNGIGTQLEPGDLKAASVKFVVQQSALQNAGRGETGDPPAYQFLITWTVIQWNEY